MIPINVRYSKGATAFVVLMLTSQVCLRAPGELVTEFPSGAYIGVALAGVGTALYGFLLNRLLNGNTVCHGAKAVWGRWGASVTAIGFALMAALYGASMMSSFSEAIGECILPLSPKVFVIMIMALASLALCFVGFEAFARYALVFCVAGAIMISIIFLVTLYEAEPGNLFPVLSKGSFKGTVDCFKLYTGVLFCFFIPELSGEKHKNVYLKATVISGVVMSLVVLFYILCLPYPSSAKYVYPLHRLSMLANSSLVFQRLDGIVYILWIFMGFLTSGGAIFFSCKLMAEGLGLKNYKAIAPGVVFLCFLISMAEPWKVIAPLTAVFAFGVLPFVGVVYKIKSGRDKPK